MALKQGWQGRTYEDFEVGDIYPHQNGQVVIKFKRTIMVYRRGHVPMHRRPLPTP